MGGHRRYVGVKVSDPDGYVVELSYEPRYPPERQVADERPCLCEHTNAGNGIPEAVWTMTRRWISEVPFEERVDLRVAVLHGRSIRRRAGRSLTRRVILIDARVCSSSARLHAYFSIRTSVWYAPHSMGGRRFVMVLAIIAAAAFAGRAVYILAVTRHEHGFYDHAYYTTQAEVLADGRASRIRASPGSGARQTGLHPPLTTITLAPVTWATDDSELAYRFTVALAGIGVVVLIGLIGQRGSQAPRRTDRRWPRCRLSEPVDERRSGDVGDPRRPRHHGRRSSAPIA